MKIFIYKTLIFFFLLFVFFQVTIGSTIRSYENKLMNNFSKDKILILKNKIREEISSSLSKEQILSPEDADLLGRFFKKLSTEINTK